MSGAIQIFKSSVRSTASPSAGGTQSNELQAAIKSVTSSTTVGAVFLYSCANDSDGGAWRKKCKGLSWFDEPTLPAGTGANQWNSATRSARSEFPAMALIVADNAAPPPVTIYDCDDTAMPMWMVFSSEASGDSNHFWRYGDATSIAALNGRIIVGKTTAGGSTEIRLVEDKTWNNGSSGTNQMLGGIVDRNSGLGWGTVDASRTTVNNQHNAVAMPVIEGSELGALGLPIPTVLCGTASGASVIHPNGSVYDVSGCEFGKVGFQSDNRMILGRESDIVYIGPVIYADVAHTAYRAQGDVTYVGTGGGTDVDIAARGDDVTAVADGAIGYDADANLGLLLYKENKGNASESAVAYITSSYNTGYMVGDIRGAWLANSLTADRSVKVNTLTQNGTVPYTAGLGVSADLTAIGPFSDSNYLSHASDTDFDFGTGDFSIMFWVKDTVAAAQNYVSRSDASQEAGDWLIQAQSDGSIDFYRHSGSGWVLKKDSAAGSIVAGQWHQVMFVKRSSKIMFYIDGKFDSDTSNAETFTPSGGSALTVGHSLGEGNSATNASLSLLRISATAPTPETIKAIYEAEKPLFAANAKCLLQSDDGSYSDLIRDLAFDKSSGILSATQYSATAAGVTKFRGLEVVDTFNGKDHGWDDEHTQFATSAGGVTAFSSNSTGCGVLVDLPALDVRAELNEGEDKIPDDGRWHFSGVTTDATATCIGQIPVAENEQVTVIARVSGHKYNDPSTADWVNCEIERVSQRAIGGSMGGRTVSRKLLDIGTAAIDVAQWHGTNTVKLMVTGLGSTRIVWKASVEVQRISEKQYER